MKRRLAEWVFRPATNQFEFFGRQKAFDQLSSSRWRSHVEFAATAKEFVLEFCDRDRAPIYRLQTANTQRLLGVRLHRIYRSPFPLVVDLAIFESEVQHRFRIRKGGQVLYLGQLPLSA